MEGTGQIISNINAVEAIVDLVKTTLGKFTLRLRAKGYGQNDYEFEEHHDFE